MQRNYSILPIARSELIDAIAFYNQAHPGLGRDFLNEFEVVRNKILKFPNLWPPYLGARRAFFHRFPYYALYFQKSDGHIVIVSVTHFKRDHEHLQDRLRDSGRQ